MKKIYSILLIFASLLVLTGCESEDTIPESELGTTHFAFGTQTFDCGVEIAGQSTNNIEVYSAFTTKSDRTLDIMVVADGTTLGSGSYNVPTSVTIPANSNIGLLSVDISDLNLSADGDVLVLGFSAKEGEYVGDTITLNITRLCATGTKSLKISIDNTDGYPDEIILDLINSGGVSIFSIAGGQLTGDYEFKECIPTGDYTLNIQDSYGDGGTSYEVSSDGVVLGTIDGSSYTTEASITFSL
jgi:hypothetical protein